MVRPRRLFFVCLFLLSILLFGCPKKVLRMPPITTPPVKNPVNTLLDAFSEVEHFQSMASIRIETVRKRERMNILLNGHVFYQRPDQLRILGYHPLGMGVFDALYRKGQFFLLSPTEKKAYTGEILEFEELIEKAGVQISTDKTPGSRIPDLIRIGTLEKQIRVDLRLKEISVNSKLPEDAFYWSVPEGVEVIPVTRLLKENPF